MKKFLCLSLALLMLISVALVSCEKDDGYDANGDDDFDGGVVAVTTTTGNGTGTTEAPQVFEPCDEQVYVKNCLKLNFREEPNANSRVVTSVEFGDEKTYHRVEKSANWSKIELDDGSFVYANSAFLTTSDGFVCFDDLEKTIYAVNTVSDWGVKLRNFTDTEAEGSEATTVAHGTPLQVTGISKDQTWYRIKYTMTEGNQTVEKTLYIYNGRYVSDTAPAPAA